MSDLPPMDVATRLERLRSRLDDADCDALLVTNLVNVGYLTGFTGSAGLLLVLAHEVVLTTDGRYRHQAREQLDAARVDVRIEIGGAKHQRQTIVDAGAGAERLGLEAAHVTWAQQRAFAEDWFPSSELVATTNLVEDLRLVKDTGEVARIAQAASIADRALDAVKVLLAASVPDAGVTEQEVALALDVEMRRLGASGSAFPTIVASGPNGAKPHALPSDRPIGRGEMVVIDFGATVDGYRSDMTRTLCIGPPATETLARMFEVVTEAQRVGVRAVAAGRPAADVDAACRAVIDDAGWGVAFVHGTGHGVGLDIHEAPAVAATSGDTLAAGHVVTVEPGVYIPSQGGVRVEDTVVVTVGGCQPLTLSPKTLSPNEGRLT
ncbi:MAG: Xaa-Pro peptidase family protein [Actinomycetota bacterium]|nr:Xaa-Pro peptidase family protein [Actinomycetota bacterium]